MFRHLRLFMLCMLASFIVAGYAQITDPQGITYTVSGTNATLSSGANATGSITIPATVSDDDGTYNVTEVAANAFDGNTNLTGVTFASDCKVTKLGAWSFRNTGIQTIEFPSTIETFDDAVLQNCTSLTKVVFASKVKTKLGNWICNGCTNLAEVVMPEEVPSSTTLDQFFTNCSSLTSITIPEAIATVGYRAFYKCTKLSSVTLPQTLTTIGDASFCGCTAIKELTVPKNVTKIVSWAFEDISFTTFKIEAVEPPSDVASTAFNRSTIETLLVPSVSVDAYSSSTIGSKATNITGFESGATTVTYNYKNGDKVWYTQVVPVEVGAAYPAIMTSPYGVTATTPTGTVQGNDVVDVPVTYTPGDKGFKFFDSYEQVDTWYSWQKRYAWYNTKKSYIYHVAEATQYDFVDVLDELDENALWAAVGNPYSFKIVNKGAGAGYYLDNPSGGVTDGAKPYMQQTAGQDYFLYDCSSANGSYGVYSFQVLGTATNSALNGNGTLNYWVSSSTLSDNGSQMTWTIVDVVANTYEIYDGETLLSRYKYGDHAGEAPAGFEKPEYVTITSTTAPTVVTSAGATYKYVTSASLPFKTDGTYYNLSENRNPTLKIYTTDGVTDRIETQNVALETATQDYYKWSFEGDWCNGFRIKNKASNAYISFGATTNPSNNAQAYLTTNDEVGSYFKFVLYNSKNYFIVKGSTNYAYISNCGGASTTFLTTWTSSGNLGDGGAQIIIEEAEDITYETELNDFKELANNTISSLAKIPVLYATADIQTATNAVAAVTACASEEELETSKTSINTALENLYKTAEGKKFVAESKPNTGYYLGINTTNTYASNAGIVIDNVMEVKYNADGKYYLKAANSSMYAKAPSAYNQAVTSSEGAEEDFYVSNPTETENMVYFASSLSGYKAIHFNTSYGDNNTCGWVTNADASHWKLIAVSNADNSAMVNIANETRNAAITENAALATADNMILKSGDTYTCKNLVLVDKIDFEPTVEFTAEKVSYARTLDDGGWNSCILPYDITIPEGMTVLNYAEIDGTTVAFEDITESGSVSANTPFLYKKTDGGAIAFDAENITVKAEAGTSADLIGTYVNIPAGSATGKLILNAAGSAFAEASATASIPAFRAYMDAVAGSNIFTIVINDDVTGVASFDAQGNVDNTPVDVYSVDGKLVRKGVNPVTALQGLESGIYIVNGKKIKK